MSHAAASEPETASVHNPNRRSFLYRFTAGAIGAIVGIVPVVTGLVYFLDPILRKPRRPSLRPLKGDANGFLKVTTLDSLPADGTPEKFTVISDVQDAWNFFPDQPIGNVWLRKTKDGIECFNTICPHLGCSVDYKPAQKEFFCPCHTSAFDLDGKKLNAIPPRDMDSLETEVKDGEILVKYQTFQGAIPEKKPIV